MNPEVVLYILDVVGVTVFAVSGALAAGRQHLDLLGVLVIAMVTALGGGTLRDVLLDRSPVFWIQQPDYLIVVLGAGLLTILYTRYFKPPQRALLIADAGGLALFSISGAQIAEAAQLHSLVIILMGTCTGVVGGVIRDVLLVEIPIILRRGNIYATCRDRCHRHLLAAPNRWGQRGYGHLYWHGGDFRPTLSRHHLGIGIASLSA